MHVGYRRICTSSFLVENIVVIEVVKANFDIFKERNLLEGVKLKSALLFILGKMTKSDQS